jgi:two-component system LytT family response regulator
LNPLRVLVVDDEAPARGELRVLLAEIPGVEVVGEAGNATEVLERVPRLRPDVLMLDIELPGRNGFELLGLLSPPVPLVIFTTAYDSFAIRAFEVDAVDYLLKPIRPDRLVAALDRARRALEGLEGVAGAPGGGEGAEPALREEDRVLVRDAERCWFVPVRSIRLLEAEGNHTRVFFDDRQPRLYRTLRSLEERLPPTSFLRANRSQIVNLACIEAVEPWFSGSLKVTLRGGCEIEFSRRQAQVLRERWSL